MSTAYVTPGPLTPDPHQRVGRGAFLDAGLLPSRGGYQGLDKARTMEPAEIIQAVKDSGYEAVAAQASRPASSGPSCPRPTAVPATSW